MSNYDILRRNAELGRRMEIDSIAREEFLNKDLAKLNLRRISQKNYNEGYIWFKKGKKLEDANKEIVIEDKKVQLKDDIHFIRGYQAAINDYGYSVGFHGNSLDEVEESFKEDKYFLQGYKDGIEAVQKQTKKSNKTK